MLPVTATDAVVPLLKEVDNNADFVNVDNVVQKVSKRTANLVKLGNNDSANATATATVEIGTASGARTVVRIVGIATVVVTTGTVVRSGMGLVSVVISMEVRGMVATSLVVGVVVLMEVVVG